MKYCLSPREIPRAEPEGFPEGSGNISSYTPTQVTIQSFSITSTSQYFLVLASRALCHGSFKSSLGNTICLEGNIATVIFQYSIVR